MNFQRRSYANTDDRFVCRTPLRAAPVSTDVPSAPWPVSERFPPKKGGQRAHTQPPRCGREGAPTLRCGEQGLVCQDQTRPARKSTESLKFKQGVASGQRIAGKVPTPHPRGRRTAAVGRPTWPGSQVRTGCREQSVIINLPCHRESRCEQQKEQAKWAALSGGEAGPEGPRARGQGLTLSVTEPMG